MTNQDNSKPSRGDIYWADLEPVVGSEQGGTRPVLILSNNLMNKSGAPIVAVAPMTRNGERVKVGSFNILIEQKSFSIDEPAIQELKGLGHHYVKQDSILLGSHTRTVSKKRLIKKIGKLIDKTAFDKIESAIKDTFALEACDICYIPLRPFGLVCGSCGKVFRKKCIYCGHITEVSNSYCPKCGKGV